MFIYTATAASTRWIQEAAGNTYTDQLPSKGLKDTLGIADIGVSVIGSNIYHQLWVQFMVLEVNLTLIFTEKHVVHLGH